MDVRVDSDSAIHLIGQVEICIDTALQSGSGSARDEWYRLAEVQALQSIAISLAALLREVEKANG